MRSVTGTQREWEELAHLDPLWAILSDDLKKFGNWSLQEFFASGQADIDAVMKVCGLQEGGNGRALDFGCGVGRLSKALHRYFGEVYGVDISEDMVKLAKRYVPNCTFVLNSTDDLRLFDEDFFDFVYSALVLQHQKTGDLAKSYIDEFVRVVKPGGLVVFQVPHRLTLRRRLQPRRRLYSALRSLGVPADFLYRKLLLNPMRTICLPEREVAATVRAAGAGVVHSFPDTNHQFSMTYLVTKQRASVSATSTMLQTAEDKV